MALDPWLGEHASSVPYGGDRADTLPLDDAQHYAGLQLLNVLPKKTRGEQIRRMRVACVPCQVNKQRCDAQRPCTRCVVKGRPHLCADRKAESVLGDSGTPVEPTKLQEVAQELKQRKRAYKKRKRNVEEILNLPPTSVMVSNVEELPGPASAEDRIKFFRSVVFNLMAPALKECIDQKSPEFLRDFILKDTLSWKLYLTVLNFVVGDEQANQIRQTAMNAVVSLATEPAAKVVLEALMNIGTFHFRIPIFSKESPMPCSKKLKRTIKEVFNVSSVPRSDLAMVRLEQKIVDTNSLQLVYSINGNYERLIGRTIEQIKEQRASSRYTGPPLFNQAFSASSSETIARFGIASMFKDHTFLTDGFELVHQDGTVTKCFGLLMADYDPKNSTRTSITCIFRPCTLTYDPVNIEASDDESRNSNFND